MINKFSKDYVITGSSSVMLFGENTIDWSQITDTDRLSYEFDFYQYGYKCKTYTDKSSQLLIHTLHPLCEKRNENCGLISLSKRGCMNSTVRFLSQITTEDDKKYISPMLFTNSICNMPNALASIEYNMKGFGNHLYGSRNDSVEAIWQACAALEDELADEIVVAAFEAKLEEFDDKSIVRRKNVVCQKEEGASAVRITTKRYANDRDEDSLFLIKGFYFNQKIEEIEQELKKESCKLIIGNGISVYEEMKQLDVPVYSTNNIFGNVASQAVNLSFFFLWQLLQKDNQTELEIEQLNLVHGDKILVIEMEQETISGILIEIV